MKQLGLFESSENNSVKDLPNQWQLSVDGASRNNPGLAGAGIVIFKNDKLYKQQGYFLGTKTNNQAEYLALVLGLMLLHECIEKDDLVLILSDSQLLVRQVEGKYKVKHPDLKPLHATVKALVGSLNYDIGHVLRADNEQADAMANEGVDKKVRVSKTLLMKLQEYGISL